MPARRHLPAIAVTLGLLAAATAPVALAQPSAILDAAEAVATVETVDMHARTVLLRGETGNLLTVQVPREVRNLPQLRPGDRVSLHTVSTVAAHIARPGDPLPESTVTAARSPAGDRPGALIVNHRRMRVTIEGVNAASNSVSFIGQDRIPRTITLQTPAMRSMLPSLKPGDEVDVTFTDAVSLRADPSR